MTDPIRDRRARHLRLARRTRWLRRQGRQAAAQLRDQGPVELRFWALAFLIGAGGGLAAIAFRLALTGLAQLLYGADDLKSALLTGLVPWWWLLFVPMLGGMLTGIILDRTTPDARARTVSDVIEGATVGRGQVEVRAGLGSSVASVVTLTAGGATGPEAPIIHLAAIIPTFVSRWLKMNPMSARDLFGCATAGAVAASFNAPLAGAIFAHEVILRHLSVRTLSPVAIAAVTGTMLYRLVFGNTTQFDPPAVSDAGFAVQFPAFIATGIGCGIIAAGLMWAVLASDALFGRAQRAVGGPRWLRPMAAGAMLGLLAIAFPDVIGIGTETIESALTGRMALALATALVAAKLVGTAITMGGRMGGGILAPALTLGAVAGLMFGKMFTYILPGFAGTEALYAFAGMAAVGASVFGAPLSAALMVFELSGGWQTGLAVLTAVSLSTAVSSRLVHRSFFMLQLERRGLRVTHGPQDWLPQRILVGSVMKEVDTPKAPPRAEIDRMIAQGQVLRDTASLSEALRQFDRCGQPVLPVTWRDPSGQAALIGVLFHVDTLAAINRALAETAAEEHG
ncbi:chloride channel protein [Paracoccus pacificus]|uniref:Chloride channel protein n=1 Tax=Paracoccus pacificus TaxID=1463598 RepID=A0ABW4RBX0_9RHOB